jgi:hypothetical protein
MEESVLHGGVLADNRILTAGVPLNKPAREEESAELPHAEGHPLERSSRLTEPNTRLHLSVLTGAQRSGLHTIARKSDYDRRGWVCLYRPSIKPSLASMWNLCLRFCLERPESSTHLVGALSKYEEELRWRQVSLGSPQPESLGSCLASRGRAGTPTFSDRIRD